MASGDLKFKAYNHMVPGQHHQRAIDRQIWLQVRPLIEEWYCKGFTYGRILDLLESVEINVSQDMLSNRVREWGLRGKRKKHSVPFNPNVPAEAINDKEIGFTFDESPHESPHDDDCIMQKLDTPEQDSSSGAEWLSGLQRQHHRDEYRFGCILATFDNAVVERETYEEGRQRVRLWLILETPKERNYFVCARIRSYNRSGVPSPMLTASSSPSERIWGENHVRAHAIMHLASEEPFRAPGEPRLVKKPLAVLARPECRPYFQRTNRACFIEQVKIHYSQTATLVGTVDEYSMPYLQVYGEQLRSGLGHLRQA